MEFVEPIRDPQHIAQIKHLLEKQPRNYCLFVLGINVPLRPNDFLNLKISNVVNLQKSPRDRIDIIEESSGGFRSFQVSDTVKHAISKYLESYGAPQDSYLFPGRGGGKPIDRSQVYKLLKQWLNEIGVDPEGFGVHSFRKTWGYHALKFRQLHIGIVQVSLGHSSPEDTMNYLGIKDEVITPIVPSIDL